MNKKCFMFRVNMILRNGNIKSIIQTRLLKDKWDSHATRWSRLWITDMLEEKWKKGPFLIWPDRTTVTIIRCRL